MYSRFIRRVFVPEYIYFAFKDLIVNKVYWIISQRRPADLQNDERFELCSELGSQKELVQAFLSDSANLLAKAQKDGGRVLIDYRNTGILAGMILAVVLYREVDIAKQSVTTMLAIMNLILNAVAFRAAHNAKEAYLDGTLASQHFALLHNFYRRLPPGVLFYKLVHLGDKVFDDEKIHGFPRLTEALGCLRVDALEVNYLDLSEKYRTSSPSKATKVNLWLTRVLSLIMLSIDIVLLFESNLSLFIVSLVMKFLMMNLGYHDQFNYPATDQTSKDIAVTQKISRAFIPFVNITQNLSQSFWQQPIVGAAEEDLELLRASSVFGLAEEYEEIARLIVQIIPSYPTVGYISHVLKIIVELERKRSNGECFTEDLNQIEKIRKHFNREMLVLQIRHGQEARQINEQFSSLLLDNIIGPIEREVTFMTRFF